MTRKIINTIIYSLFLCILIGVTGVHLYKNWTKSPKMSDPCTIFGDDYPWRLELLRRGWGPAFSDTFQNYVLAANIVNGEGFSLDIYPPYRPTMFKTPLYELLIAGLFKLSGNTFYVTLSKTLDYQGKYPMVLYSKENNIDYIFYMQTCAIIIAYFIFFHAILRFTNRDYWTALLGTLAVMYLTKEVLDIMANILLVYALSPLMISLLLFSGIKLIKDNPGRMYTLFLGLTHGLTPLFIGTYKHIGIVMAFCAVVYSFLQGKTISKKKILCLLIYLVAFMVPSLVWMTRNYRECGSFKISNQLGSLMYGKAVAIEKGAGPYTVPGTYVYAKWKELSSDKNIRFTDTELDKYMMKEAKEKLKHLRGQYLLSMARNFYEFNVKNKKMLIINCIALLGIILSWKTRNYSAVTLIFPMIYFNFLCIMLTIAYFRHNIPLIMTDVLVFAVGIDRIMNEMSKVPFLKRFSTGISINTKIL